MSSLSRFNWKAEVCFDGNTDDHYHIPCLRLTNPSPLPSIAIITVLGRIDENRDHRGNGLRGLTLDP